MEQPPRRLIGISGATASGKSTIARGLIAHFGADTHRFSAVLADVATALSLPTDKASLQAVSTTLRSLLGEDVLARGMCAWVKKNAHDSIVIEGIRRLVDIELLKKTASETSHAWTLIYVDAPTPERFVRLNKRLESEEKSPLSESEFRILDTQECELELPTIQKISLPLLNTDTLEHVLEEAVRLVESN